MDKWDVLVLGGSSFIGRAICGALGRRALPTYHTQPIPSGIYFDARTMELGAVLDGRAGSSHAILLFSETKPDNCFREPEASRDLNVIRTRKILSQLKEWGLVPVFASTEAVFNGERGRYVEADPVEPILLYGKHKVEVEDYIRQHFREYLILRISKVHGTVPGDGTIFTGWMESILKGDVVTVAHDRVTSPIHCRDVARAIELLIAYGHSGTFHVGTEIPLSKEQMFEELQVQARRAGLAGVETGVRGINDFDLLEQRPLETSSDPSKLLDAIGVSFMAWSEACQASVSSYTQKL